MHEANSDGQNPLAKPQYPFQKGYQKKILALLLQDRGFLPRFADVVESEYFTAPLYQATCDLILEHWRKYRLTPTFEVIEQRIKDEAARSKDVSAEIISTWQSLIVEIRELGLSDRDAIQERLIDWIKQIKFEQALVQCAGLRDMALKTGKFEFAEASKIMLDALMVGQTQSNITDYLEETTVRMVRQYSDDVELGIRIPLLMGRLDTCLEGGPRRQEMIVWAGPPSRGKTASLCWASKQALFQGKKVAYFTHEMSRHQIADRLDRSISMMNRTEVKGDPELMRDRVESSRRYQGMIKIVELIGRKNATVDRIHHVLQQLRQQEAFEPDIVLCDYPGMMYNEAFHDDRRTMFAETFKELKHLAGELDVVVHAGWQMRRDSLRKAIVTIEDLADCFEVAAIADIILGICQTKEEEEQNKLRFFVAKNRDGQAHFAVPFYFYKDIGVFARAGKESFYGESAIAETAKEHADKNVAVVAAGTTNGHAVRTKG